MAYRKRKDPRSTIIDGSQEIPLAISAKIDKLHSMRDYFVEIYGNDHLFFDIASASVATLSKWSQRHTSFYKEACSLMADCLRAGVEFEPDDVNRLKNYHLEKAQVLTIMIVRKSRS